MVRMLPRDQGLRAKTGTPAHRQDGTLDDIAETLAELGLVAVPLKPTMEQIVAGTAAAGVSVDQAWRAYSAMLRAAEETPKG